MGVTDNTDWQGGVQNKQDAYRVGQLVNWGGNNESQAFVVEGDAIPFARAVGFGVADGTCKLGGSTFIGVSVNAPTWTGGTDDQYETGAPMSPLRKGQIRVKVTEAVVKGVTPVRFLIADGTFGAAANPESGTATAVVIANANYETSADAGGEATLRLA